MSGKATKTLKERFDSMWIPEPYSGCWLWTGSITPKGYGTIRVSGRSERANRISWMIKHNNPPPSGMFVCHKCDTRCCVNPDHLFLGTARDNNMDAFHKGKNIFNRAVSTDWLQARTITTPRRNVECKNGHLVSGENVYITPAGKVKCRTCLRTASLKHYYSK